MARYTASSLRAILLEFQEGLSNLLRWSNPSSGRIPQDLRNQIKYYVARFSSWEPQIECYLRWLANEQADPPIPDEFVCYVPPPPPPDPPESPPPPGPGHGGPGPGPGPGETYPPIADAGGPYSAEAGQLINFDGSRTTDPDTPTGQLHFSWSFGDGATQSGLGVILAQHIYPVSGEYLCTLTVTDPENQQSQDTAPVSIRPVIIVAPTAEANGPYQGVNHSAINFSAQGSTWDARYTQSQITFDWDFGDGTTGQGFAAQHTYNLSPEPPQGGTALTVRLTVTDPNEGTAQDTATVTVTAPASNSAPTARVTGPQTLNVAASGTYDCSSTTDNGVDNSCFFTPRNLLYRWNFGDGSAERFHYGKRRTLRHFEKVDMQNLYSITRYGDPAPPCPGWDYGTYNAFVYGHVGYYEVEAAAQRAANKRHFRYMTIMDLPNPDYVSGPDGVYPQWFEFLRDTVQNGWGAFLHNSSGWPAYFNLYPNSSGFRRFFDWAAIDASRAQQLIDRILAVSPDGVFLDQAWLTLENLGAWFANPSTTYSGYTTPAQTAPFSDFASYPWAQYAANIHYFYTQLDAAIRARDDTIYVLKNGEWNTQHGYTIPGPLYLENSAEGSGTKPAALARWVPGVAAGTGHPDAVLSQKLLNATGSGLGNEGCLPPSFCTVSGCTSCSGDGANTLLGNWQTYGGWVALTSYDEGAAPATPTTPHNITAAYAATGELQDRNGANGLYMSQSKSWSSAGVYNLQLTALEPPPCNLSNTVTLPVTVSDEPPPNTQPVAVLTGPTQLNVNTDYTWDASGSYDQETPPAGMYYKYDWGDGNVDGPTINMRTKSHRYTTNNQSYTIRLTVYDGVPGGAGVLEDMDALSVTVGSISFYPCAQTCECTPVAADGRNATTAPGATNFWKDFCIDSLSNVATVLEGSQSVGTQKPNCDTGRSFGLTQGCSNCGSPPPNYNSNHRRVRFGVKFPEWAMISPSGTGQHFMRFGQAPMRCSHSSPELPWGIRIDFDQGVGGDTYGFKRGFGIACYVWNPDAGWADATNILANTGNPTNMLTYDVWYQVECDVTYEPTYSSTHGRISGYINYYTDSGALIHADPFSQTETEWHSTTGGGLNGCKIGQSFGFGNTNHNNRLNSDGTRPPVRFKNLQFLV